MEETGKGKGKAREEGKNELGWRGAENEKRSGKEKRRMGEGETVGFSFCSSWLLPRCITSSLYA